VTSYRLSLSLAASMALLAGCGEAAAPERGTHAFEVVETYGETSPRSVSIRASWFAPSEERIEFANVSVKLAPGEQPMVKKLEMLLEETGMRWQPGSAQWPELSRAATPDAAPMIARLQLALMLQEGANVFEVERPLVNVFSSPPTLGLTRLARRGDAVWLSTIALVMSAQGSVFAWSHSTGTAGPAGVQLTGTRRIGDATPVPISTSIRQVEVQAPSTNR
jgi:hypothetical protein